MDPQASQSQDCEPTPPLQRHNSNFYLPPMDGDSPRHVRLYHPRHSPHAVQRYAPFIIRLLNWHQFNMILNNANSFIKSNVKIWWKIFDYSINLALAIHYIVILSNTKKEVFYSF